MAQQFYLVMLKLSKAVDPTDSDEEKVLIRKALRQFKQELKAEEISAKIKRRKTMNIPFVHAYLDPKDLKKVRSLDSVRSCIKQDKV